MSEEEKVKDELMAKISEMPLCVAGGALPTFRINEKGHHVPESLVKPIDAMRDELVLQLIDKAKNVRQRLSGFKGLAFDDITAFVQLSVEKYKVDPKSKKRGNITLLSFDGRYKIQVQSADRISFDERLQAAKSLIDGCIEKWSEGGNSNLKALIHDAFNTDKEGNIDARRILSLRRVQIDDEDWKNAMQAISDAVQVVGSKEYIRFYEKDANGDFQAISLDFAGL